MGPAKKRPPVTLTSSQRLTLQRWVRARTTPQRVVLRSTIVLLAAEGMPLTAIAQRLRISRSTAQLWCRRFSAGGPSVLLGDAPGRGRKPTITGDAMAKALNEGAGAPVSIRQLARRLGASSSAVHRALTAQRQFRNTDREE